MDNKGNKAAVVVDELMVKFAAKCDSVKESTKVQAGETKEAYVNRMEAEVDAVHVDFNAVLVRMSEVLGFKDIMNTVYKMMDAGLDGSTTGKNDLFKMADRFKATIKDEIAFLNSLGNERSFKDAITLKAYTEDSKGTNIFESFIAAIVWIGERVARKLKQWFNVDDEASVMNALCRKLSYIGGLLRKNGKFCVNGLELIFGLVIYGVVKVFEVKKDFFINIVFKKVKAWEETKDEPAEMILYVPEIKKEICESTGTFNKNQQAVFNENNCREDFLPQDEGGRYDYSVKDSYTNSTPNYGSETNQDIEKQITQQKDYDFHTKVAGVTFENRQQYVRQCKAGQSLDLIRDNFNPYDKNAIAVYAGNNQVGYISKEIAVKMAPRMDNGKKYDCSVQSVTGGSEKNYGLNIKVTELAS